MPERRTPLQGRFQVDNRDLYGYTTPRINVVARPNDSFTYPSFSPSTRALLDSLSSIQRGLQGYVQYKETKNKEDYQEGELARGRGEELTEREKKSKAFLAGWETLDGRVKAKTAYMQEISEYLTQNQHLDSEEFTAGLAEISKKYLEGASDSFIKGFLPEALELEARVLDRYQARLNEEYVQKRNENMNVEISSGINSLLIGVFEDMFDVEIDSLHEWLSEGENFRKLKEYSEEVKERVSPLLRELLDEAIELGKEVGMDTPTISDMFLKYISTLAITTGVPELIDYAYISGKDGVAVIGTSSGSEVMQRRKAAEESRKAYDRALDSEDAKRLQEEINKFKSDHYFFIADLSMEEDRQAAIQKATERYLQYKDNEWFSANISNPETYLNDLLTFMHGGGVREFPINGNFRLYAHYHRRAVQGDLTMEEFLNEVLAMDELNQDQAHMVYQAIIQNSPEIAGEGAWKHRTEVNRIQNSLIKQVANSIEVAELGDFALDLSTYMEYAFAREFIKYREANDGAYPDPDEWMNEIGRKVLKETKEIREMVLDLYDKQGDYGTITDDRLDSGADLMYSLIKGEKTVEDQYGLWTRQKNWQSRDLDAASAWVGEQIRGGKTKDEVIDDILYEGAPQNEAVEYVHHFVKDYTKNFAEGLLDTTSSYEQEMMNMGFDVEDVAYFKQDYIDTSLEEFIEDDGITLDEQLTKLQRLGVTEKQALLYIKGVTEEYSDNTLKQWVKLTKRKEFKKTEGMLDTYRRNMKRFGYTDEEIADRIEKAERKVTGRGLTSH